MGTIARLSLVAAFTSFLAVSSPQWALADTWTVDAEESAISLNITQLGKPFEAKFNSWTAEISFDPAALDAATVTVSIDVASFASGAGDRDKAATSDAWLKAGSSPTAVFEATRFSQSGDGYVAEGTLQLAGTSVPVTLPFDLVIEGDTARMTGMIELDRKAFGIGVGNEADGAVGQMVGVSLSVTAKR